MVVEDGNRAMGKVVFGRAGIKTNLTRGDNIKIKKREDESEVPYMEGLPNA